MFFVSCAIGVSGIAAACVQPVPVVFVVVVAMMMTMMIMML